MHVQYKRYSLGGKTIEESEDAESWVESCLKKDGVDARLKKLAELLAALTARHLTQHPKDVVEVARVIDCEGNYHELVPGPEVTHW